MFRNAKVGDIVFDIREGVGKITGIQNMDNYPIKVGFTDSDEFDSTYLTDGRSDNLDTHPSLFWENPWPDGAPKQERPKMEVEKTISAWINVYIDNGNMQISADMWDSEEKCINAISEELYGACIGQRKITHTYTVLE